MFKLFAAYFSTLKPRSNIRVVETATVPKTFVAGWFLAASKTGEKEPIGQRIIEVPEDLRAACTSVSVMSFDSEIIKSTFLFGTEVFLAPLL